MKKQLHILLLVIGVLFLTSSCHKDLLISPTDNLMKDIDGNVYKKVTIGDQTWMAENLRTTKYNDGTQIPYITVDSIWSNTDTAGYCWYDNNKEKYKYPYGALYRWRTVETGKLCPSGWHVPSVNEWNKLIEFVEKDAGKLKIDGIDNWSSTNTETANEYSFSVLPGGRSCTNNGFWGIGGEASFWSSTGTWDGFKMLVANNIEFYQSTDYIKVDADGIKCSFSIRCIMDE